MSNSALASLTAQYTDSENEEHLNDDDSDDSENSHASQVIIPKPIVPIKSEDISSGPSNKKKEKKRSKKSIRRLVSYQDDTLISDEDDNEQESSEEESENGFQSDESIENKDKSENEEVKDGINSMELDDDESDKLTMESKNAEKYAHYGFSLPPPPKGKPSAELVEKIRHLYEKMETNNMDMNKVIQERKEFRNPSIYEKLIQFCDINEFGTNYPPEIYDPLQWGPESYYEELARVQKNEMSKRQKERKESDKIEQATALARKVEEEAKRRKSKWDQPASVKPVIPPALTTTVTGTKGTVISAFGSLPRKPTL